MKTVCYIHSYPACAETLAMLWPGFKLLGIPLIGVDCVGDPTLWPEPIETIEAGINAYATEDRWNLPSRMMLTLRHFISTNYDRCLICEYDTLISGPMPEYPEGFVTHRAGGQLPGTKATQFFHSPWIFDRTSARLIMGIGMGLLRDGMEMASGPSYVHGSPDVFLGLIVDMTQMAWTESGTCSFNTIDSPDRISVARKAYQEGCWFIHGFKTRAQLEAVTG